MKKIFFLLLVTALLLSGCGESSPTEPVTTPTEPSSPSSEPTQTNPIGDPLSEEQLQTYESLFAYPNWYNSILRTTFSTPEDADLYQIFYNGVAVDGLINFNTPLTQEEADRIPGYDPNHSYDRSTTAEINSVLRKYLGIDLDASHKVGLSNFIYVEELDAYYHMHTDSNALVGIRFTSGYSLPDGTIQLYYKLSGYPEAVVTLKRATYKGDEVFQVISNLELE